MTDEKTVPVFDGHNDVLLRLWRSGNASPETLLIEGDTVGHIDLPRAKKGGLAGGLCAAYVPSPSMDKDANGDYPTPTEADALKATLAMAGLLFRAEKQSAGALKVCRTAADIRDAMAKGAFASVFHIEGAEAIGADLDALYVLYEAGLRTLGPVWSRPNIFAYGVPFRFPSTPDIGPGLTEAGKRLIKTCNELKIMVDLSHMNEQGFWDIAKISDAPLVASHSNAHALCPCSRNLTDRQLDAIRETGGLIGVNLAVSFLRPDGRNDADTPMATVCDHVEHLVGRLGVDGVGLGTDFDGCTVPRAIGDAAGLQRLLDALRERGWGETELTKFAHRNWLRVLEATWGA